MVGGRVIDVGTGLGRIDGAAEGLVLDRKHVSCRAGTPEA